MAEYSCFLLKGKDITNEVHCITVCKIDHASEGYKIETANGPLRSLYLKTYLKGSKGSFTTLEGTLAYVRAIVKGSKEKDFDLVWTSEDKSRGVKTVRDFLPGLPIWFINSFLEFTGEEKPKETKVTTETAIGISAKIAGEKTDETLKEPEKPKFVRTPTIQYRRRTKEDG